MPDAATDEVPTRQELQAKTGRFSRFRSKARPEEENVAGQFRNASDYARVSPHVRATNVPMTRTHAKRGRRTMFGMVYRRLWNWC